MKAASLEEDQAAQKTAQPLFSTCDTASAIAKK